MCRVADRGFSSGNFIQSSNAQQDGDNYLRYDTVTGDLFLDVDAGGENSEQLLLSFASPEDVTLTFDDILITV